MDRYLDTSPAPSTWRFQLSVVIPSSLITNAVGGVGMN